MSHSKSLHSSKSSSAATVPPTSPSTSDLSITLTSGPILAAVTQQLQDEVIRLRRRNVHAAYSLLTKDEEIAKLNEEVARLQLLDDIHRFGGTEERLREDCERLRRERQEWHDGYQKVSKIAKNERARVLELRKRVALLEKSDGQAK
ncbi:uncharacterized protein EKO05_0008967 [Ascochyta rabiei]|uniref:Uncharacterized protein n=1 Tax=Didymella rabiei TaxID=5454 RepID=A0A163HVS4_DIDRA|nr:uncharacterized protein EKO05_0008967 [Ascochyta rabiei]KZM25505.1 hypothetical protein ST47_g3368 [Ascochyta rabiei]UPX18675.1 hypothetical protein EKO05_0008967 [Ascochyta rabiei]